MEGNKIATIAIGVSKDPSGTYTCKLPLSSLMESDVPPSQGDSVEFSVQGTVQSVDGNTATIKIDSVNDEPVGEEASESPEEEGAENSGAGESTPAMGARLKAGAASNPVLGIG